MSYAQLRAASDQQLIESHDNAAKDANRGVRYYLEELARRETERLFESIMRLTA